MRCACRFVVCACRHIKGLACCSIASCQHLCRFGRLPREYRVGIKANRNDISVHNPRLLRLKRRNRARHFLMLRQIPTCRTVLFHGPAIFGSFHGIEHIWLAEGGASHTKRKRQHSCLCKPCFCRPQSHRMTSKRRAAVAATAISLHEGQKLEILL